MADELQLTLSGTFTNVKLKDTLSAETLKVTQNVQGFASGVIIVGIAEEDMAFTDITTLGWLYLKNLDTANYVTYGPKSGAAMVAYGRLRAGEFAIMRLEPGITLRWIANTSAVRVQFKMWEH